jgi:hypothetical protein
MTLKQFKTAAREADRDEPIPEELEFGLDGRSLVAYYPGDGALAILMAETSQHQTIQTKVAGAIDYFYEMFNADDAAHIRKRLLDKNDPFGFMDVQDIIEWVVEEWSGNPTRGRSASTRSRSTAGQNSRRRTPASA